MIELETTFRIILDSNRAEVSVEVGEQLVIEIDKLTSSQNAHLYQFEIFQ